MYLQLERATEETLKRQIAGHLIAFLALVALPSTAFGQGREARDVHLRNDCRQAAQILTTGHPAPHREWALGVIWECDESGPPVLAELWRKAEANEGELGHLIWRSVNLRDTRLYGPITAIARDPNVPEMKRAAALSLLGRWARPGLDIEFQQFFAPGFTTLPESGYKVSVISHDIQDSGAQPLAGAVVGEIRELAEILAQSDGSPRVRAAAGVLTRYIQ